MAWVACLVPGGVQNSVVPKMTAGVRGSCGFASDVFVRFVRRKVSKTLQITQFVLMVVAPGSACTATCMVLKAEGMAAMRGCAGIAWSIGRGGARQLDEIVAPDGVMPLRPLASSGNVVAD